MSIGLKNLSSDCEINFNVRVVCATRLRGAHMLDNARLLSYNINVLYDRELSLWK